MTPHPSQEARRALREARERREAEPARVGRPEGQAGAARPEAGPAGLPGPGVAVPGEPDGRGTGDPGGPAESAAVAPGTATADPGESACPGVEVPSEERLRPGPGAVGGSPGPGAGASGAARAVAEEVQGASAGGALESRAGAGGAGAAHGAAHVADGVTGDAPAPGGVTETGTSDGPPEAGAPDGAPGGVPAGSAAHSEPRPGDIAREALRRALAARREPQTADGNTRAEQAEEPGQDPDSRGAERAGAPVPPVPPRADEGPRPTRPADVAREALRAARGETHRDVEAAEGGAGTGTGAAPARDDRPHARRGGRGGGTGLHGRGARRTADSPGRQDDRHGAAARARELREMLSGAFRLPPETDDPGHQPPGDGRTPGATAESERPAHLPDTPGHVRPGRSTTGPTGKDRATPDAPGQASASAGPDRGESVSAGPGGRAPAPTVPPAAALTEPRAPAPSKPSSPPPPTPPSMAAPARDGESRRTFPPLPARPAGEGPFAGTWWGNAWVAALEEGALDAERLVRGRGYAEQGHVDAITVTPGLVLAYVQGSRPRPYRVQVRLRTLEDADWERFLDAAAERPGHVAALLDKELPHSLADCGVPLLPGPGDLAPRCSCPDSGHPCKHAAALCYQTARLLDADPFVLLLLRGRGERRLLDSLSRLSAARAARAARERAPSALPGVRATDALARREPPAPPPPLPVPPHPEQPPVYPAAPGGPDPFALDQLATDAAARAHALLTTGRDPVAGLTLWQDAVRLAAARPGSGLTASTRSLYSSLAAATGRTPADLARAVAAWRQGGLAGLTVLEDLWDPPAGRFDRARPLLLAADLPAFRPWHNTLTHPAGHLQLRLGRDGLWYAYESEPGHDDWWPRGTPDLDPVGALTGLGIPDGRPGAGDRSGT